MKSHITAALLAMALLFNSISALACAASPVQMASESEAEYDTVGDPELIAMLTARGRAIRMRRFDDRGFMLNGIVRLLQNDPRWANVVMQSEGLPIGTHGCALTSFTIVSNWLSNRSQTPADVNTALGNYACDLDFPKAATIFGYQLPIKEINDNGIVNGEDIILGAIDMFETPVIVGMIGPDTTHYVVAYGYDSSYNIMISDPAGRNYTLLSQYFNEGYYIHRIYMYLK